VNGSNKLKIGTMAAVMLYTEVLDGIISRNHEDSYVLSSFRGPTRYLSNTKLHIRQGHTVSNLNRPLLCK
jgi:hypothetical protein